MSTFQIPTSRLSHIVRGSGPGLVLAHGAGGSIRSNFGAMIAPLAKHFTVVGPDYPGSGTTPRARKPLQLDELADQLVATAVQADVEKFAILGYSLGSVVAIRAATRHSELITALILTAGFAQFDCAASLRAEVTRTLAEREDWKVLARFLTGSFIGEQFLNTLSEEQIEAFIEQISQGIPAGYAEQADLVTRVDVRQDLPHISVPTLVINMKDERILPRYAGQVLAEHIPGAQVAELDSGHAPIDCAPEWFLLVQNFLATVPAMTEGRKETEPLAADWHRSGDVVRAMNQLSQRASVVPGRAA